MKQQILSRLTAGCPWADRLHWFDTAGSTNDEAKAMAAAGAPHGTVLVAGAQTGGRGRMGRSFSSPAGLGVYLSVILRPDCAPGQLMHLTCAAAVAMCDAVQAAAGFRPCIKWTNDLVWETRKLGGILTELSLDSRTGRVQYAVVGIGINCRHRPEDFPPELRHMAASLAMAAQQDVAVCAMAAAMVDALVRMDAQLLTAKEAVLDAYRADCITLGRDVVVVRGDTKQYGRATDIDAEGALVVRFSDGTVRAVSSGEVSVRGMYGYI